MQFLRTITSALSVAISFASPAVAMSFDDIVKVTLLDGWRMETGQHMAGIRISLEPGWHTYWRQPGDAGIPPVLDWSGSRNMDSATIIWPMPEVFEQNELMTIGYHDEVVLPLLVEAGPGQVALEGRIFLGVCKEVCIPVELSLSGVLPNKGKDDPAIRASLDSQPKRASEIGYAAATCAASPISDGLRLTVSLNGTGVGKVDALVIETGDPTVWVSEPVIHHAGRDLSATSDLVPADAKPFLLARSEVVVTLFQSGRAVEYRGCTAQ